MTKKWHKFFWWLDDNLFFLASIILIFLIPLWPKIPLADILPGYIVRLRLEDLVVAIFFLLYLIWWWRGKVDFRRLPGWQLIFANIAIGLMAILSGMFLLGTIPFVFPSELIHVSKSLLHWARYIEYFFLAFVAISGFKNFSQLKITMWALTLITLFLGIYSIGQKYYYWPVYSTMNREFSKGVRLYIDPGSHARIQATFGGHYDFGGYLVLILPFSLQLLFLCKRSWQKVAVGVIHFLGVWSLIVCAARTSVIAYLVAISLLLFFNIVYRQISLKRKCLTFLVVYGGYFLLFSFLVFGWGQDMMERFAHTFSKTEPFVGIYNKAVDYRNDISKYFARFRPQPPENGVAMSPNDWGVLTPTDTQPVPVNPGAVSQGVPTTGNKPADVYVDVPDYRWQQTASGASVLVATERTWSVNAERYGLSMAIRYDTLWPHAWQAFQRNPLIGSGYATLVKGANLELFTEADSTDNNYLRTLGETGILGLLTFYGVIILSLVAAWRAWRVENVLVRAVVWSFSVATVGILINAILIDVFAASKVAFSFWLLLGMFYAAIALTQKPLAEQLGCQFYDNQSGKSVFESSKTAEKKQAVKKNKKKKGKA